jgi:hypothetical protein
LLTCLFQVDEDDNDDEEIEVVNVEPEWDDNVWDESVLRRRTIVDEEADEEDEEGEEVGESEDEEIDENGDEDALDEVS